MQTTISRIAIASLLASSAFAQSFNSDLGTSLGVVGGPGTNDEIIPNVNVGFPFTFPDGTTTSAIDIDINGRILLPSPTNTSEFDASVPGFTTIIPMICPYWRDLDVDPATGDIFVNSTASQCTITWANAKVFGGGFPNLFTLQVQLNSDNSIAFCYDERVISEQNVVTGVSAGPAGVDNGEIDLDRAVAMTGGSIVYEEFGASFNRFDLRGGTLSFTPNGTGYDTTFLDGGAGVTPYGAERFGKPCPVTFEFIPDGAGGYAVLRGPSRFIQDDATAVEFAINLSDDANTPPMPLGFNFEFPGGTIVNTVIADNNGRLMINNQSPSLFRPIITEFLDGPATISPFWTDLSSQRGSLRLWQGPGVTTVTWDKVPKFAETETHTFQVAFFPDGSFNLNYLDVSAWQTNASFTSDDVLIGCSTGAGATDPGFTDFSTGTIFSSGVGTIYEFFDATDFTLNPRVTPDIHTKLEAVQGPFLGQNLEVNLTGINTSSAAASLLVGFTPLDIQLDVLGLGLDGCSLYTDPVVTAPLAITGTSANFSLPIGTATALQGLPIILQGAVFGPDTSAGLSLTNAVRGTVQ